MRTLLYAALLALLSWLPAAHADPTQVHSFTLPNGLQLHVRRDPRAPVVATQLRFQVGSGDEPPGQSGLSHALEHMLFQNPVGSDSPPFLEWLEDLGAESNAFTTPDATVFHQTFPLAQLDKVLQQLAERMAPADFDEATVQRELRIIQAERRQVVEDDASTWLNEQLHALAHPMSGYRTPVIGWMDDIRRLDAAALNAWRTRWYVPNNASLVVVGDVQPAQVEQQVRTHFAALAAQPLPPARQRLERSQSGLRTLYLSAPDYLPMYAMAFNVPAFGSGLPAQDIHALRLLDKVLRRSLSGGQSTFAAHDRRGTVIARRYLPLRRGDTLLTFSIQSNPLKPAPLEELLARADAHVSLLHAAPPTAEALDRARTRLRAELVFAYDDLQDQARLIGSWVGSGQSPAALGDWLAGLEAVRPEDIQRVARTWLTRERLSVAYLNAEDLKND